MGDCDAELISLPSEVPSQAKGVSISHPTSCGPESTLDVRWAIQPRDVLFQFFDHRTKVTAVLAMFFLRASLFLETIVLAPQRGRLLFQRLMLGLQVGHISGLRLSSHDGFRGHQPIAHASTACIGGAERVSSLEAARLCA